jgi:hypothetical protein
MIPLNHTQIEEIRIQKRDLEVEVAKALNGFFQQHYKYSIQRLVHRLILHILSVEELKLTAWLIPKRREYLTFQRDVKPTWVGLNEFLNREPFWTLENCSDMIRLFGETNERWKDFGLHDTHLKGQQSLRPEPTFLKVGSSKPIKEGGWGGDFGHRDRKDVPKEQIVRRGAPYEDIGTRIVRGVDKYKFEPKSVIGAIDRTFGLRPEGADISGTTTDSIYALRWAGGVAGVSPDVLRAIQLLPLVTMVPQGHHTIVECSCPLSRQGYIDYHIGYYTTLVPKGAADTVGSRFNSVLAPFDEPARNKHILVWGSGAGEQGVQMEGKEIEAFKKMARVLSAYGFCVAGGLHDFGEALNVVKTFTPSLVPALEQLRGQVGLSELERKFRQFGLPRAT